MFSLVFSVLKNNDENSTKRLDNIMKFISDRVKECIGRDKELIKKGHGSSEGGRQAEAAERVAKKARRER